MIIFQQKKKKKNRDFKRAIRLAKEIKIEKKNQSHMIHQPTYGVKTKGANPKF